MALPDIALPDIRKALVTRFSARCQSVPKPVYEVGSVVLGRSELNAPIVLPRRPRQEHMHCLGTTGSGKTNLLEILIRQDIKNGDGVFVVDPHGSHPGSLFRSLIAWCFAKNLHKTRTIHLIDPNCPAYTTGFNPLELPKGTSPSVIAGTVLEAFERVWGGEDTHSKPTIRRILKGTFAALAELGLTLAQADCLFDHHDELRIREFVINRVQDRYARKVFSDLDQLANADRTGMRFRDEIIGPLNRLAEFTSTAAIRQIVGQRDNTIDLAQALDQGHIVLVNLSGGDAVNDADCELLGRLLTRFVFFHVKRRSTKRPFWMYLDECQRYLSGDIASLLAESRKFALSICLSHQWSSQASALDEEILAAIHNATNVKIAFRIKHPKEAQEVAEAIMPLNLEQPVETLIRPTVVGQQRVNFANWSESDTESSSTSTAEVDGESFSEATAEAESESASASAAWSTEAAASDGRSLNYDGWGTMQLTPRDSSYSRSNTATSGASGSETEGTSASHSSSTAHSTNHATITTESHSHSHSSSRGASEGLEPIYEDLPTAVHSIENARYLAAQKLRSLPAGQAFASFVDATGLHTTQVNVPLVQAVPVNEATFRRLRALVFARSPSAIATPQAIQRLEGHDAILLEQAQRLPEGDAEPSSFRVPAPRRAKS